MEQYSVLPRIDFISNMTKSSSQMLKYTAEHLKDNKVLKKKLHKRLLASKMSIKSIPFLSVEGNRTFGGKVNIEKGRNNKFFNVSGCVQNHYGN